MDVNGWRGLILAQNSGTSFSIVSVGSMNLYAERPVFCGFTSPMIDFRTALCMPSAAILMNGIVSWVDR